MAVDNIVTLNTVNITDLPSTTEVNSSNPYLFNPIIIKDKNKINYLMPGTPMSIPVETSSSSQKGLSTDSSTTTTAQPEVGLIYVPITSSAAIGRDAIVELVKQGYMVMLRITGEGGAAASKLGFGITLRYYVEEGTFMTLPLIYFDNNYAYFDADNNDLYDLVRYSGDTMPGSNSNGYPVSYLDTENGLIMIDNNGNYCWSNKYTDPVEISQ